MSKIKIQLSGVGAELVLGNYMPLDTTIFNDWQEFFHYNDLIHYSQLMMEHVSEIEIRQDDEVIFRGKIPVVHIQHQKSYSPALVQRALYLRTECVEQAIYYCEFETNNFDRMKLLFETQDYDLLFKTGKSFLSKIIYDEKELEPEWFSGKALGNICLLCRYENGYLIPIYDAVKKMGTEV